MRVYSYVIDHDLGFAPNPFHGICTLAACKPMIRETAQIGDYVVGTGSKPNELQGRLIYWMKVEEITSFHAYWTDPRFRQKRPRMNGCRMDIYGDNIYHLEADGSYRQEHSFHSQPDGALSAENLQRDTSRTDRVLIAREFAYWGQDAPLIPEALSDFVHTTQAHRCRFSEDRIEAFISWIHGISGRGFLGRPSNWPR